jgi:hypothetical protein
MNPIQLLAPQSLRVIGQSNGLATIELSSSPNGKLITNLKHSFTFSTHSTFFIQYHNQVTTVTIPIIIN